MAAPMGLKWIGCELEEKFVTLARQNFDLHAHAWQTMGYPLPVILKGDSRHLSDVIGQVEAVITSPPYAETIQSGPPGIDWDKAGRPDRTKPSARRHHPMSTDVYSYSSSPSNIGNLKAGDVAAVVTSPPFSEPGSQPPAIRAHCPVRNKWKDEPDRQDEYGRTGGNIGNEVSGNYWSACAQVYRECYKILKPGGVLVCVVKAYVKAGRRVPLPMQTLKLLIHLGFTPLERIKAMLVEETSTPGLFGEITKKKERKSFFRRLAEKKGSPRIDMEEVLIVRKP